MYITKSNLDLEPVGNESIHSAKAFTTLEAQNGSSLQDLRVPSKGDTQMLLSDELTTTI